MKVRLRSIAEADAAVAVLLLAEFWLAGGRGMLWLR